MQPGIIAIILVAAVAHAIWNTASKYKRGDTVLFVWAYTAASMVLWVPIGAVLVLDGAETISWNLALGAVVSAVLHVAYSLTLQAGYDRAELGVVYPIARGTGPVLTMLFAILVLAERPSPTALLGALVVVGGITVVTGNPFRRGVEHAGRGVLWGGATGATIAAYTLWDSFAVTSLHLAPIAYYAGTLVLETAVLTPSAIRRRGGATRATVIRGLGEPSPGAAGALPLARAPLGGFRTALRANAVPIAVVAVFSPLAYILVLTAMQSAPVALVAPLRESSIVIGSLLAWWLFHETHLARRLAGAAVVLAGITAISL